MTDEIARLLAEAEAHDKAATPGPWEALGERPGISSGFREQLALGRVQATVLTATGNVFALGIDVAAVPTAADAAFIAWARTAVPKLAAALRESEERANGIANVAQWRGVGLDNAEKIIAALRADLAAASKALVALAEYAGKALCPSPDMSGRWLPPSGKQVQAIVGAALARPGVAKAAEEE